MYVLSKQEKQNIIDLASKTAYIIHFDVRTADFMNFYIDDKGQIIKAECLRFEDRYTDNYVDINDLMRLHRVTVIDYLNSTKETLNDALRSIEIIINREELGYRMLDIIEQALQSKATLDDLPERFRK